MIKTIALKFDEKTWKKLENAKEEAIILGKCTSWETWILMLARLKK